MIGRIGLQIRVHNEVTGHCPDCPSPDIEFDCDSSSGLDDVIAFQDYVARCRHASVCKLRDRFMEEVGNDEQGD
jgi:hypothetical protein